MGRPSLGAMDEVVWSGGLGFGLFVRRRRREEKSRCEFVEGCGRGAVDDGAG